MRYTFFLYSDESAFAGATEAQMLEGMKVFGEYIESLKTAGVLIDTDWLQPSTTATTLSLSGGKRKIEDGPYADSKEQIGGTFVIDVPNLDAAIAWAEKCPTAHYGIVEIRASAMPEGGNPHAG